MPIKIALAGNPNSGKTTLFNALTGSNQFVGNWPGVTVEKKEGRLKGHKDVTITDLPGIYSLSPYTLEEVVARNYLLEEHPDVILNIVDGTNLERNLYLTTQLCETGIPVVIAVNMMDTVHKNGGFVDTQKLSKATGCTVFEISALKGTGIKEATQGAVNAAGQEFKSVQKFSDDTEEILLRLQTLLADDIPESEKRFFAIKAFERDEKFSDRVRSPEEAEKLIKSFEEQKDDDSESIIVNERYELIAQMLRGVTEKRKAGQLTLSDKIDRTVTNRWLSLPIFAAVMTLVYYVSISTVGGWATDFTNDNIFGEGWHLFGSSVFVPGIPDAIGGFLEGIGTSPWLQGLIVNGIVGGVGAVLGFVPQMFVLFFFLAILESCGYMARIAFIMDRIFRKFGLSGKSFIPMLIGTGCGVPGIMASRTIENDRDRKMTVMTTTFIPCSAKLPIIALIAGALFADSWWVAPSAYFIGVAAIIISGIMLKKSKLFAGDPAPFVMELPAYHLPTPSNVLRSMWERGWSFIKKAGSIILLSSIFIWFTSNFGFTENGFGMVEDLNNGLLANIGSAFAWIFAPLGWGNWQSAVAAIMGLVAKENVVSTFGILYGFAEVSENGQEFWSIFAQNFSAISAYSFLVFNLLCAPCFAAMGAIKREMNNGKWTAIALGYQTLFAYGISLCIYQFGLLFTGAGFSLGTAFAIIVLAAIIYFLFKKPVKANSKLR